MIRYLKECHTSGDLYFTSEENCETCETCGDSDSFVWSYDTDSPINKTLKSLFYLIIDDLSDIRDIEDLKLIQKELNFDLDMFNKFKDLLDIKNKLKEIEFQYYSYKYILGETIKEMNEKNKKGESNENN